MLFCGQNASDRHDITARVFNQKLNSLIDLITTSHIFGEVRRWLYSVEWQKRGLPHAHILIWVKSKTQPTQLDDIICAETPNQKDDPVLYETIKKHMIHGPCGICNLKSPCMVDKKCTKRYPRTFVQETQTGGDGYPLYRRRKPEDGGKTLVVKVKGVDVTIDNRWVVPNCPFLSKIFDAHINVGRILSFHKINQVCFEICS